MALDPNWALANLGFVPADPTSPAFSQPIDRGLQGVFPVVGPNGVSTATSGQIAQAAGQQMPTTGNPVDWAGNLYSQMAGDKGYVSAPGYAQPNRPQMTQQQAPQFDWTPLQNMMNQFSQQMGQWGNMFNQAQTNYGPGSGQFGNFGGQTSPVYRPNQGSGNQPTNGWGGPFGKNNPWSPTF